MKVLYILDPATKGGATESFLSLICYVQKHGVEPVVCTSSRDYLNDVLDEYGIKNVVIRHNEMITTQDTGHGVRSIKRNTIKFIKYLKHDIQAISIIRKSIDMKEIDMIHTNSSRSDIGFFLSMLYHKPHVVHLREFGDLDYECYPLNPLWVHIYNIYSSRFICVSKAIQEHWVNKGIKRDKTTVIYNGINHERVSVSHDDSKCKNPMKIVMSGGVMKSKGQYLAIEALGELPSEVKHNVTLDFIGHYWDSYKAQLDDMIIRNKLQQQVQFLGARDDVLQLLKNYHVGLMCSRAEGFGRVTAEYMFAGLGVVASDSGANSELITNMIDGLLFYKDDSRSLSKAIEYYFYHREMLIKHANAARIKARRMFTAELYAERVCKIYQQIIDFA